MADEVEPVVSGIQKRFRDLSVDVREERVIRYIVNQLRKGRRVDEIMSDTYITNHTSEVQRAQILENPAVIRAIEEEIRRQFETYQSVAGSVGRLGWHPTSPPPGPTQADDSPDEPGDILSCPTCGLENTADSNFCRRCGTRLGSRLGSVDPCEATVVYSPGDQDTGAEEEFPTSVATGPVLLIRAGGGREGEVISLSSDVLTIGRSPHSDLFLDDVTVSRHHARIIRDENGFLVEDLNSLNGTYVNRKRVERHRLADGDELQIGKYKLAFIERE